MRIQVDLDSRNPGAPSAPGAPPFRSDKLVDSAELTGTAPIKLPAGVAFVAVWALACGVAAAQVALCVIGYASTN